MADEPITEFERRLYAGEGFDNLVTGALKTHETELSWMSALLLQFKNQKPTYRLSLRPRIHPCYML